jgi:hypothetical protein
MNVKIFLPTNNNQLDKLGSKQQAQRVDFDVGKILNLGPLMSGNEK